MIYNLTEIDLNGSPAPNTGWWTWDETCSRCGKLIKQAGQHYSNVYPSELEATFCTECQNILDKVKGNK